MKFVHISDVFLGIKPDRGRTWSDKRAEEIEESFRDVLRICEDEKVDLLLIAGNLYSKAPTTSQLRTLDYLLRTMRGTKTIIIAGDRDYIEPGSDWENFQFESDTVVLPRDRAASVYIDDLNVSITGYSYGRKEYTERMLERLKPSHEGAYHILLGHGGDATHMPFSKERLAKLGFDYIALGHIRKPSHILKNHMAFSGSLEPLNYKDTGRRGYILGEVDENQNTKISWIPHNKVSYVNLTFEVLPEYSNKEIQDLIEDKIKTLGTEHIYRIMLKGLVDSNLQLNLGNITQNYLINEIIDKTELDYDEAELYKNNADNLLGRLIEALSDENSIEDETIRSAAKRYGIEALLSSGE